MGAVTDVLAGAEDDGATLADADPEAVVDAEEAVVVTEAALIVDAVVAGAVVLAETGLAVLSKHLQALET